MKNSIEEYANERKAPFLPLNTGDQNSLPSQKEIVVSGLEIRELLVKKPAIHGTVDDIAEELNISPETCEAMKEEILGASYEAVLNSHLTHTQFDDLQE